MFEVVVHVEVEQDVAGLDRRIQKPLITVFRQRLAVAPEEYGKPLSGPMHRLRRVRMGDYRIAYQVQGRTVKVWAVRHRREVYNVVLQRIRKPFK